jgi:predicted CoA-substrate-specific enzyme activase
MITAGVDAGSRAIKVALIDTNAHRVLGTGVTDQGVHQQQLAADLLARVCSDCAIDKTRIGRIVATGYGRDRIADAHTTITEITCHARGIAHQKPDARTVIDIGGQDSKVLRLDTNGTVRDFMMNDRCAAGTGRFLEVVADRLNAPLTELGALADQATAPAHISSMCVVFAETEIIGLLAQGTKPANIVAGVQSAIATRIASMAGPRIAEPVCFTGGVARIPGMDKALADTLGHAIAIAHQPQFTGAVGAALLASEQA